MSLTSLESQLRTLQFTLRQKAWGQLRLRRGLPQVRFDTNEIQLYSRFCESVQSAEITDVIDVGCRNWSYAPALRQSFPNARLFGVELDGYRRYFNLFRRIDFAQSFAQSVSGEVLHGDFMKIPSLRLGANPLFTFFFPFVSSRPCLKWGLPVAHVNFFECLKQARNLAPHGFSILSVHQGDWESDLATGIYKRFLGETGSMLQEKTLSPDLFGPELARTVSCESDLGCLTPCA